MLPGFRFLFAAIALSMSILVFGLGAAALLRTAHEAFASISSRRATPETMFAAPGEATSPVLAMLRVEPPATELRAPENVPAATAPVQPTEPSTIASPAVEPETTAALKPEAEIAKASPETIKAEIPAAESLERSETSPAQANVAAPIGDTKTAANEATLTKTATLGGPPVITQAQPPTRVSAAKPDKDAIKKRLQAQQAIKRRRIAQRARLVQQAAQPADPFAQPVTATPKR